MDFFCSNKRWILLLIDIGKRTYVLLSCCSFRYHKTSYSWLSFIEINFVLDRFLRRIKRAKMRSLLMYSMKLISYKIFMDSKVQIICSWTSLIRTVWVHEIWLFIACFLVKYVHWWGDRSLIGYFSYCTSLFVVNSFEYQKYILLFWYYLYTIIVV